MKKDDLKINKKEVLRYLGYRGQRISNDMEIIIDECIEEIYNISSLRSICKYSSVHLCKYVVLKDVNLTLKGEDIARHLRKSNKCCIIAATLGIEVDRKISYYERINMTKAVILDACATSYIEAYCDFIEDKIKKEAKLENLNITYRFSPGYGDFNISMEHNLLEALKSQENIGLTVSSHDILIPTKSVTAIIGLVPKNIIFKKKNCSKCNIFKTCKFRKTGDINRY